MLTVLVLNRLPFEFWRVLHAEYGIVVYPSALTEEVDVQGLGIDVTFTDAYTGHIGMIWLNLQRERSFTNICRQSCLVDAPIRVTRRHALFNTCRSRHQYTRNRESINTCRTIK